MLKGATPVTLRVDPEHRFQRIDGFGVSEAFGRARILAGSQGLPAERVSEVLDLLFGPKGAALSILRLCIGASRSDGPSQMRSFAPIGPRAPGLPLIDAWDGDDAGQAWLAARAAGYGVQRIFAHPLSAPSYVMHRCRGRYDGLVRGMSGTSPAAGDWRPVFAEYLLQYVRHYAALGLNITDLGFAHQPDLLFHRPDQKIRYPLLRLESPHVVDLVKVMGRQIERSGIAVNLVCGNAFSWDSQMEYTAAVEADDDAARYVDVYAANRYTAPARRPLPTQRPTWMTEWDPEVDDGATGWNDAWDSGRASDGLLLAADVHDTLTVAGVSGYLYLFGASARESTRALIWLDGERYHVSSRFWALAAFSRFIRPGAFRVVARVEGDDGLLRVAAFTRSGNAGEEGQVVVQVLNLGDGPVEAVVEMAHPCPVTAVRSWLTDERHALAPAGFQSAAQPCRFAPRSLTTLEVL